VQPLLDVEPDLARMRAERRKKLTAAMREQGTEALVLLGESNVRYATGAAVQAADQARAHLQRPVAVVKADGSPPHLFTAFLEGVPDDLRADHVHDALPVEHPADGTVALGTILDALGGRPQGTVAFDEYTMPLYAAVRAAHLAAGDAGMVVGAAKLTKTIDELACIRRAQAINERAMLDVQPRARPGVRQCELSARFLRRIQELGATANSVDPIWQAMPPSVADGPCGTTREVVFPTPTTDRILREGDVVWVDSGMQWNGYASDFGRTWLISRDPRPTPRQRDQHRRWRDCVARVLAAVRPGATGADLTRAAREGEPRRPWLSHFYLIHGTGLDNAEMPLIGTDLGEAFDEALVLTPGMVMVLEPIIWEDGHGGYRAEDIVAVTDDGWVVLSDHPYAPFDETGA